MEIDVADPFSVETPEQRQANLDAMNAAAARLLELGHIPLIGMNAALPVLELADVSDRYKAVMDISLAFIAGCDALMLFGERPGASKERDLVLSQGKPVYRRIEDIHVP